MTENETVRFKISLYENGVHSLKQGLEAYKSYQTSSEPMQLKDAIMSLHHGVELLLKEMLVRHNQFLIFENLRNVAKKQKKADRAGVGIFYIDDPPRTVTFHDALIRVDAFICPDYLDDNLIALLKELNRYRNQLEHYAVDADLEEVAQLIADIHDPLMALLDSSLGDIDELRQEEVEDIWNEARDERDAARQFEKRIKELMDRFGGQKIIGSVFSRDGDVVLPDFDEIEIQYRLPQWPIQRIDILGLSQHENWAVEVKRRLGKGRTGSSTIHNLRNIAGLADAVAWLVLGTSASDRLRRLATDAGVMLSDKDDIEYLEGGRLDQERLF